MTIANQEAGLGAMVIPKVEPWSKLACEMVDGAESDPESTHFERIVFLLAVGWRLDPFPVVFLEERVVEGIKRLPLVISQGWPEEASRTVLPAVVHEPHGPRTRIFGVLHNFLHPRIDKRKFKR